MRVPRSVRHQARGIGSDQLRDGFRDCIGETLLARVDPAERHVRKGPERVDQRPADMPAPQTQTGAPCGSSMAFAGSNRRVTAPPQHWPRPGPRDTVRSPALRRFSASRAPAPSPPIQARRRRWCLRSGPSMTSISAPASRGAEPRVETTVTRIAFIPVRVRPPRGSPRVSPAPAGRGNAAHRPHRPATAPNAR
jgi:hypothetical protein